MPRKRSAKEERAAEWQREVARRVAALDSNTFFAIPFINVRPQLLASFDE